MTTIQAIILGAVQGMTEFLPVSSSGHLVLFQHLFGLEEPELLFDICLHVGTLMAVLVVFYREIAEILTALVRIPSGAARSGGVVSLWRTDPAIRLAVLIVVGSVPTAIIGFLFKGITDRLFGSPLLVGGMLLVTGTLLWLTRWACRQGRPIPQTTLRDAVIIGIVQGLAIIPGISRSGSTISTALFLGVDRKVAGRYSFLLSIPAILGALLLGVTSPDLRTDIPIETIIIGLAASAIIGWLALIVLLRVVDQGRLHWFAPYCWLAGLITMAVSWIGG